MCGAPSLFEDPRTLAFDVAVGFCVQYVCRAIRAYGVATPVIKAVADSLQTQAFRMLEGARVDEWRIQRLLICKQSR